MKRFFLSMFFIASLFANARVQPKLDLRHIPNEEKLSYNVFYSWGLIWKKAGRGDFSLHEATYQGERCLEVSLFGRTLSWAEKILKVRDTLQAYCHKDGFIPKFYTKIVHEGKYYSVDEARYSYFDKKTDVDARIIRESGVTFHDTLSTTSPVYDMLSVFYYLRSLNLKESKEGDEFSVMVMSGKKLYHLKFVFLGKKEVKIRTIGKMEAFQVQLIFLDTDGKIDDDSMIATIADDTARTPLQLEAKLKIGKLKAILDGAEE